MPPISLSVSGTLGHVHEVTRTSRVPFLSTLDLIAALRHQTGAQPGAGIDVSEMTGCSFTIFSLPFQDFPHRGTRFARNDL
jgi:hypothetical protein